MKKVNEELKRNDEWSSVRPISLNLRSDVMDIDIIDLCTPSNVSIEESNMIMNQVSNNNHRLSILPWYPTTNDHPHQGYPLLTNISPRQLSEKELVRRRANQFKSAFHAIDQNPTIPSFLREKYHLFYSDLIERLKVDMSILDYNYTRLNQYIRLLMYEQMKVFTLQLEQVERIDEKEYPLALEFYLQFDMNMFYMKTCSFRSARPRTMNEGLFCLQEPEARYELSACGNCGLCYPQYDRKYRSRRSIVDFSQAHRYTFLNGYQSILNCSAGCHTRNIIYVLRCPCEKFEYVGATMLSLHDRLQKHREHGNRMMHEFLLGQDNILRDMPRMKTSGVLCKDRMKLYQHSVRCPVAMQIFLDVNPQYWRFVPMTFDESEQSEQKQISRTVVFDPSDSNSRTLDACRIYIEAVPKPPSGYTFSDRQILLQTEYFHQKRDQILPNEKLDLYDATIVAVLPEKCSSMFRYLIESLFITHGATTLNTIGNVLNENQQHEYHPIDNPWLIRGDEWCQGLVRRPQPRNPTMNT